MTGCRLRGLRDPRVRTELDPRRPSITRAQDTALDLDHHVARESIGGGGEPADAPEAAG
jgi:hypothetical protein